MKRELRVIAGGTDCGHQPMTSLTEVEKVIQDEVSDEIIYYYLQMVKELRGPQIENKIAQKYSIEDSNNEDNVLKDLHSMLLDKDPYYKSLYISLILEYQEKGTIRA